MPPDHEMLEAVRTLSEVCRKKKLTIAAAESCTGGLLAATITDLPGSSDVFDRGFVTYSNEAKERMLGVPPKTLANHGAVSRETAQAMVKGTLAHTPVDLAVAITGIAGPAGAMPGKPIGLVHLAAASRGGRMIEDAPKFGDLGRSEVRRRAALRALAMLLELAEKEEPRRPAPVA